MVVVDGIYIYFVQRVQTRKKNTDTTSANELLVQLPLMLPQASFAEPLLAMLVGGW